MIFAVLAGLTGGYAQSTSCNDWNEYVDSKNTGGTGYYILSMGGEESAAQTYYYSGPGRVTRARVDGMIPSGLNGAIYVLLDVSVYNVDANNRPTGSPLDTQQIWWWYGQTSNTVNFSGGGVPVNGNYAIVVNMWSYRDGVEFHVKYTGDGEGNGDDLPSVAGSTTGGNWISLLPSKDGDLYLVPRMQHTIFSDFSASETCATTSTNISFSNNSVLTMDSMFNIIGMAGYAGSENYYSWDFGDGSAVSNATNPSHMYNSGGLYTVSLTSTIEGWGGTVCTNVATMDISVGLDVSATNIVDVTCHGDNSGSVTASGMDGEGNYMYSLDGVNYTSSATFSNLYAGNYILYVKDGLGCTNSTSFTISEPSDIAISSPIGITGASCGNADGGILASASGGSGSLEYSIDGSNYQSSGAFSGLNSGIYVVYVKDANNCIKMEKVIVTNTNSPSLTLQSYTNISCNGGSDGTITLIGSGGTGALEYSIDGSNWQSSGSFTNLPAGSYNLSVKDAAGCIGTIPCTSVNCSLSLVEPTEISFALTSYPVSCNGGNDGEISVVNGIGGTGTFTYSLDGTNYQSSSNFEGLAAGSYTVYVKDVAGCVAQNSISVTEPTAISVSLSSTDATCNQFNDGMITAVASGGNGGYLYSIDYGSHWWESGEFESLGAGAYTVMVRDSKGCTGSEVISISDSPIINATVTSGNSTCGNANGTLLAVASGGSGSGYQYSIDGGATFQSSGAFSGLEDGSYYILVQDGMGCENPFKGLVVDSDGPTIASVSSTDITCHNGDDGSITVTSVTGGTGSLTYSIGEGVYQSSDAFYGLSAGDYTVVVQDANGCTGDASVTLAEPNAFSIVLSGTNVFCNGSATGAIDVSAAGGSGALAYSIDGVNFQSSTTFNNLTVGHYTVTVKDAGGCTGSEQIWITEPSAISMNFSQLNVSCNGGSDGAIYMSAVGGTGTIAYSIDGVNYQSTGTFTGLSSGVYAIHAKDANGCDISQVLIISQPSALGVSASVSDVSCAGGDNGVIDVTPTGGTAPYTYLWSNSARTEDIFNLVPGTYSVAVTDANGCTSSGSFTVTEPANPIIVNGTVTNASGVSNSDGGVDITVSGGTAPYSYDWSDGSITEDISGVSPDLYSVTVTDVNGCEVTQGYAVSWNVGIDDVEFTGDVNIYPNPANTTITVQLGDKAQNVTKIALVNISGQVVFETTPNSNKVEFNVSSYADGMYFTKIYTTDNQTITKRVVIEK